MARKRFVLRVKISAIYHISPTFKCAADILLALCVKCNKQKQPPTNSMTDEKWTQVLFSVCLFFQLVYLLTHLTSCLFVNILKSDFFHETNKIELWVWAINGSLFSRERLITWLRVWLHKLYLNEYNALQSFITMLLNGAGLIEPRSCVRYCANARGECDCLACSSIRTP